MRPTFYSLVLWALAGFTLMEWAPLTSIGVMGFWYFTHKAAARPADDF